MSQKMIRLSGLLEPLSGHTQPAKRGYTMIVSLFSGDIVIDESRTYSVLDSCSLDSRLGLVGTVPITECEVDYTEACRVLDEGGRVVEWSDETGEFVLWSR